LEESRHCDINKCNTVNWLHVQQLGWNWDRLLFWEQQSSLNHNERTNRRNGRLYSKCNTYTNANCHADTDSDSNANPDPNSNSNRDRDVDTNYCAEPIANCNLHSNVNTDCDRNGDCNRN
jgi:hypothetical protein